MERRQLVPSVKIAAGTLLLAITPLWAGLRGPGNYSGVVFFDRWDTCMLLSGPYLTCISESVKEDLRPYSGKAIQIDASQVFPPTNPGDALIRQYTIIGPAPAPHRFIKLDGLDLRVKAAFEADRRPRFLIFIQNNRPSDVTVLTQEVGITVLGNRKLSSGPSDGRSDAVITRSSLFQTSAIREWASDGQLFRASFAIVEAEMPDRIKLLPLHFRSYAVALDISPGQYQFVFGYGGGVHEEASLLSNAISFDVSPNGLASIVN